MQNMPPKEKTNQEKIFTSENEPIKPDTRTARGSEIPYKEVSEEYNQSQLYPSNIFDLLPEDHECFIYNDIIEQIDVTSLHKNYKVLGQNAFNPKIMIGILIYAYSLGIFSSRKIAERLKYDLGFMLIGKLQKPNFRVISDFRKNNIGFFKECFKQTVKLAMGAGLVSMGHISLDGSKFKANTSKHKAMSYGRLKAKEKELEKEVESLVARAERCDKQEDKEYKERTGYEIPDDLKYKQGRLKKIREAKESLERRERDNHPGVEIDDKKQISFTDHDAPPVTTNKEGFDYRYNGQISVDEKNQIIVGEHLSQNSNDKKELAPAIKEVIETSGSLPDKISIDNGYMSGENLRSVEENNLDAYIAVGRGEKEAKESSKLMKEEFNYQSQEDRFECPAGKILELKRESTDGKRIYKAKKEDCDNCPMRENCCSSKKGEPRSISTDEYESLRQSMREKMSLEESKIIYGDRKKIVEPVFGQIKNSGFRGFSLRGEKKVSGEFSLVCAVHNIKKLMRAIRRGLVAILNCELVPRVA